MQIPGDVTQFVDHLGFLHTPPQTSDVSLYETQTYVQKIREAWSYDDRLTDRKARW